MNTSSRKTAQVLPAECYKVRLSMVHGDGVFATRKIIAGARIIEYGGKRISEKQADQRFGLDPDNPYHTFFFSLDNGRLIDGGDNGNDARWINHSCQPKLIIHASRIAKRKRKKAGSIFMRCATYDAARSFVMTTAWWLSSA